MIYIVMFEICKGSEIQNKGNFVSDTTISNVSTGVDAIKSWREHVSADLGVDESTVIITGVFKV